jgi:hypothetical protein
MRNNLGLIGMLLISYGCLFGNQKEQFPSGKDTVYSPDRKFVIQNFDPDSTERQHRIFLKDVSSGKQWELMQYNRHVEVAWSPNSTSIAVTDFDGSNHSGAYVFFVDKRKDPVNIEKELLRSTRLKDHLVKNDHVYIKVQKWLSSTKMEIAIEAYGDNDPHGYSTTIKYELKR